MSSGAGRLERAVIAAMPHRFDVSISTEAICRAVYPEAPTIEKKHRVAVLQVLHRLRSRPPRLLDEHIHMYEPDPERKRGYWKAVRIAGRSYPNHRKPTAYHEAGHALVDLYFGIQIGCVVVHTWETRAKEERRVKRQGLEFYPIDGFVRPIDDHNWFWKFMQDADQFKDPIRALQSVINLLAGSIAEAHYEGRWPLRPRGLSKTYDRFFTHGGQSDVAKVDHVLTTLSDDPNQRVKMKQQVTALAQALIRSEPGWKFIELLAAKMLTLKHGSLSHRLCAAIFNDAFGQPPPSHRSWDNLWPPTLPRLRAGWLPPQ